MLVRVLTYNISWATQINKELGSEAGFVKQCQISYKEGGKQCTKDAIKNIGRLKPLDLVCLQEVSTDLEGKIMKVQSRLKKFKRGKVGLSTVSTLWNPEVFGQLVYDKTINLIEGDDRPCLILLLKKGEKYFIIINLHAPWRYKKNIKNTTKLIKEGIESDKKLKSVFFGKDAKIIAGGDFNDAKTELNRDSPIILKDKNRTVKLRYKNSKRETRRTLKSCCWHEKGNKYGYFEETGDYILVNKNIKQKSIKIPEIFKKKGRLNRLFSDHMPVESVLEL